MDTKIPKYPSYKEMGLTEPEQRLKILSDCGASIDIDFHIPPRRYYRSGVEMIRMANVYMEEGSLEHAYVLYMKFMTIFLEKIRTHPQYNTVPLKDRAINQQTLREVLPKAEALKKQLLEQYRVELAKYAVDAKKQQQAELERLKQEEQQRLKEEEDKKNKIAALAAAKALKTALSAATDTIDEETKSKNPILAITTRVSPHKDAKAQTSKDNQETPTVDRSTKPSLLASDKHVLRDIVLPSKTMNKFLVLALNNTMNNKETCGVLAGKLERNKLLVTHLLIPRQTGSPDSCMTYNEEDIFDYQDQHNLITLGWIHTHPTQTAFLSSVDLHTHCAYQLMMSEAIAVVCAPKYQETGFYILTPEYGLDFIANCRETGFHPHPTEPPLYMDAKHCKVDSSAIIEVVDLRK